MPEMSSEEWADIEAQYLSGVSMHELERQYKAGPSKTDISRTAIKKHLKIRNLLLGSSTPAKVEIPVHVLKEAYRRLFTFDRNAAETLRKYLPRSCMNDEFDRKYGTGDTAPPPPLTEL